MDPMTAMAIGSAVAGIGTSIFGGIKEKKRQERMKEDFAKHQQQYEATGQAMGGLAPQYQAMGERFSNMTAPELAKSRYEGQQAQFANMMADAAAGRGPSQAQMQLQRANDAAIANQMAMANSGRGNAMAAQFNAARNAAALNQEAARQSALLRQQEMMDARGLYGQALGSFRGQDLQAAQANQAAALQSRSLNQQAGFAGLGGALGAYGAQLGAQQASAGLTQARYGQPSVGNALMAGGMSMTGQAAGMYGNYLMGQDQSGSASLNPAGGRQTMGEMFQRVGGLGK